MQTIPLKTSKVESIHHDLESKILSSAWMAGDCLPTEIELSTQFACNRATVAKAIARLVHQGLVERRKRGGTRVLRNSLENRTQRVELDAFACIYPSEKHEGIARLLRGFQEASQESGRRLVMLPTGLDFRKETELLASLGEFDVKGAVACPVTASPQAQLNVQSLLLRSQIPVVLMGAYHPGFAAGGVHLDNFAAGHAMTRYLLDQGVKRIGFLANWSWSEFIRERFAGYEWAMREANAPMSRDWICLANAMHVNLSDPIAEPQALAKAFLATKPNVEAVVCADDFLASGLIRAASEIGLRTPEDLKVTGMDNLTAGTNELVPLTTLNVPFEEIGRKSFTLLDNIVAGRQKPGEDIKLHGHVISRRSA